MTELIRRMWTTEKCTNAKRLAELEHGGSCWPDQAKRPKISAHAPERIFQPVPANHRRPTTPPNLVNTGVVVPSHTARPAKVKRGGGMVSDTDWDDVFDV
ncbi:hypothetical protein HBI56_195430 [Parastagonospora nodorum]|uniref:Uncharacterized protein n=2 Tax=Phaeosphaeria nodorum (strain SN15 / ATCC MYA-4574 / FGSC 10173) TaxID=321614 RepID=A0A7U2EX86_PHANO|nr:hypothetical protein SNOG_14817 [Parastagonospora nodorum SN15]KAH3906349.1 hypothetical protein HBH56_207120 [Parastagonospora nodorum]EAT77669.1 hypothetical protein SNOG_14817 [Parastagonospora nodorum SN15]KAH3923701.1 hypothetical protein HBH54_205990 [Parastagonospora nodorum]KAH3942312.1 hypothetical protein HBH53_188390 [Parastagonospora nodorum]KAH3962251.1 hypothetical protein HBH51_177430 [Parastagonospora nodorum]